MENIIRVSFLDWLAMVCYCIRRFSFWFLSFIDYYTIKFMSFYIGVTSGTISEFGFENFGILDWTMISELDPFRIEQKLLRSSEKCLNAIVQRPCDTFWKFMDPRTPEESSAWLKNSGPQIRKNRFYSFVFMDTRQQWSNGR